MIAVCNVINEISSNSLWSHLVDLSVVSDLLFELRQIENIILNYIHPGALVNS
jgi:hypothetical protein